MSLLLNVKAMMFPLPMFYSGVGVHGMPLINVPPNTESEVDTKRFYRHLTVLKQRVDGARQVFA